MLVKFFKSIQPATLLSIPIIGLLLWIPSIYKPSEIITNHSMPLYEWTFLIFKNNALIGNILSVVLVITGAYVLNYVVSKHEFFDRRTYLPSFFYLILMSCYTSILKPHPSIFSNILLIISIHKIISSYRKETAFSEFFDASFLIALASLFYLPSLTFLIFVFISLLVIRPFIWREWAVSLIGFLLPFIFVSTYYWVINKFDYLWYDKMIFAASEKVTTAIFNSSQKTVLYILAIIVGLSLLYYLKGVGALKLKTQRVFISLMVFSGVGLLSLFISTGIIPENFTVLAPSLSIFISYYFMNIKKTWIAESLVIILLIAIVSSYFV